MGAASSSKEIQALSDAFERDQCTLERTWTYNTATLACAKTRSINHIEGLTDPDEMARRILKQEGSCRRVYLVTGEPYDMGFVIGMALSDQVESMCTTYLNHISPQFISEEFDVMMRTTPALYQTAYELILSVVSDILVKESFKAFKQSVQRGDIPQRYLDEMRGVFDGANSVNLVSGITWERIVACNYGLDYLMCEVFSGKLLERIRHAWPRLPEEVREKVPQFRTEFMCAPDMCNAAMLSGEATRSGEDVYLLRDFQFSNAHVFHRNCTMIIRKPLGRQAHIAVAMPGMIGHVTYLNESGVAGGVNLVRSSAVDPDRIGIGCMFLLREMAERGRSSIHTERIMKEYYMGAPWLMYSLDRSGDGRVYEMIAAKHEANLTVDHWVSHEMRKLFPSQELLNLWRNGWHTQGVWSRTGRPESNDQNDSVLRTWNVPLLGERWANVLETQRWKPGAALFNSWTDEAEFSKDVGNMYFCPWRYIGNGCVVISNAFVNPLLRLTQMGRIANISTRFATGVQWRYDTMTSLIKEGWGLFDMNKCKDTISFLSPWKRPLYPQNTERRGVQHLEDFLSSKRTNLEPDKERDNAVPIAGALSVVDICNGVISTKTGYWGSQFYTLTLGNYTT